MTSVDVALVKQLGDDEYQRRIKLFEELLPKLQSYIRLEAAKKASKSPTPAVDEDDFVRLGESQVWIAVLRWNPDGGASLTSWAKRLIWTNMAVMLDDLYQQKRTARIPVADSYVRERLDEYYGALTESELSDLQRQVRSAGNKFSKLTSAKTDAYVAKSLHLTVMMPTASLFEEVEEGVELVDSIIASEDDPIGMLIAEELYSNVRRSLLRKRKRVAAGVLRYIVHPDKELVRICQVEASTYNRMRVQITNKAIARRLGVTVSTVADAKASLRSVFRELMDD